ncbi:MAG: ribosome assembly factor SBDS [Nanoarchaeota archaeon]
MPAPHDIKYDKEKVSFNLARLKIHGHNLEIVVDPDKAVEYKTAMKARSSKHMAEVGEPDVSEVLKSEEIFHDAHKGQLASEHFLEEALGTSDPLKVAEKLLLDGEIQLTAEHRKRILDAKRRQIIQIIHKNAIDPTTNLPHPAERIERMLGETHFRVDEYKKAEDQVDQAVHALKPVIPIKFDVKRIEVTVYQEFAHKVYGTLKQNKVLKESWNNDGSLTMVFEVPAGLRVEFIDRINEMTHGNVEINVLEDE